MNREQQQALLAAAETLRKVAHMMTAASDAPEDDMNENRAGTDAKDKAPAGKPELGINPPGDNTLDWYEENPDAGKVVGEGEKEEMPDYDAVLKHADGQNQRWYYPHAKEFNKKLSSLVRTDSIEQVKTAYEKVTTKGVKAAVAAPSKPAGKPVAKQPAKPALAPSKAPAKPAAKPVVKQPAKVASQQPMRKRFEDTEFDNDITF